MEPHKVIAEETVVPEEENNCEEETNLTPQVIIDNIDWCKCQYECKRTTTIDKSFCSRDTNEIPEKNFKIREVHK